MLNNTLFFKTAPIDAINEFSKRINSEFSQGKIGYYHLPEFGAEIAEILEKKEKFHFKNIVLMGIGGSSLGVRAVYEMLECKTNLIFLDNTDPHEFTKKINSVKFDETGFIISSKSGTTIEPITLFKCVIKHFNVTNFKRNFIIITEPNSPLEKFAKKHEISVFNVPQNVSGRFSVLSAIGLVPLYFCGVNIKELLNGAKSCKERFLGGSDDLILQKAYHYATHKSANINVLFSYSDRFASFNDWFVQLWAESLGKKREYKRIGRTPVGLIGSKDQHSFLQLIMDGVKDKTLTFIKIKKHGEDVQIPNMSLEFLQVCDFVNSSTLGGIINFQCDACLKAVIAEGVSVDLIEIDEIDEWHIGNLIYYFELLTSATGIMLGINTYDQPGVEAGKRILKNIFKA